MSYWETSALAKLYVPEPDSPEFETKAAADPLIVTSQLTVYEMRRVAFRKESQGLIQPGSAENVLAQLDLDIASADVRILAIDPRVEAEFKAVMATCYHHSPPIPVRTFDALHLASGRVVAESEIVSTDKRLRDAANLLVLPCFRFELSGPTPMLPLKPRLHTWAGFGSYSQFVHCDLFTRLNKFFARELVRSGLIVMFFCTRYDHRRD